MCDTLGTQQVKHFQIINECVKYFKTMVQKRRKLLVEFEGGKTKFKCRHECGKRLNHAQSVRYHERNVSSMCSLINFLKDS